MILLAAFALVLASVPVFGGRLGALSQVRLRGVGFIFASLALQIAIFSGPGRSLPLDVGAALHFVTYGLAIAFILVNSAIRGLMLLACGGLANLAAITANGGRMPASDWALSRAGNSIDADAFVNSGLVENPRLAWLGDIFVWPQPLPLANVFSIGDITIVIGATILVHSACGSRLPWRRTSRRAGAVSPAAGAVGAPTVCFSGLSSWDAPLQGATWHAPVVEPYLAAASWSTTCERGAPRLPPEDQLSLVNSTPEASSASNVAES